MKSNPLIPHRPGGFTILEVLFALTASLLLMIGLTRAFKLIGDRITASQSELELAGSLRDATFRMRDELRRITVPSFVAPQPVGTNAGYFHYYEGPWTDATTTLVHGAVTTPGARNYFPTSRYGDLDDYLAFTTRSEPERPFSGLVPAGIVEAIRLQEFFKSVPNANINNFRTSNGSKVAGSAAVPIFTAADAVEPVVIYSEVAEVCYFLAPQWTRNALGVPDVSDPTVAPANTSPQFIDVIDEVAGAGTGDGVPDRLTLHRRVLLVRQDLNMTLTAMNYLNAQLGAGQLAVGLEGDLPQLPFLSGAAVLRLYDLPQYSPGVWDTTVQIATSPNWLTGMARVHQWMDLSVSRHIYTEYPPLPATPPTAPRPATPLESVRANSLEDLTVPDNRFAAIRIPVQLLDPSATRTFYVSGTSSMPLLALSPPHALITANATANSIVPPNVVYSAMGGQAAGAGPYSPFTLVGFMRPEFTLADHWYDALAASVTPMVRPTLRGGSDVIATNIIGFDVKVYDPDAPIGIWMGPDAKPGIATVDDDTDSTVDNASELGYAGSDDVQVDVGSRGFRTALSNFDTAITTSPEFGIRPYGDFVDNGYARLAGGSIGGTLVSRIPSYTSGGVNLRSLFVTPFSGVSADTNSFPLGWGNSGRLVLSVGAIPSFYQASIDTWSDYYKSDDFVQNNILPAALNVIGNPALATATSRYWTETKLPESAKSRFVGAAMLSNSESEPPYQTMPSAIKITIRVYDPKAGEMRQQSIIEHFQ